jgi:hypothetical protein
MTTHPTGGAGSGPGRTLFALLDFIRAGRARHRAAAAQAGARSTFASPLSAERREDNYRRQNGSSRLTSRQQRRRDHKANRAAAHSAA